jgi:hypothetical protein
MLPLVPMTPADDKAAVGAAMEPAACPRGLRRLWSRMADGSTGDAPLGSIWVDCIKDSSVLFGRYNKQDYFPVYAFWIASSVIDD